MPLPDATKDKRIYQLLKNIDLGNLTFSEFQTASQTVFAEPEAEDTLRRIVLVNLARMSVAGDWTGLTSAGGGGSGYGTLTPTTETGTYDGFEIASLAPWGSPSSSSNVAAAGYPVSYPFVAPVTGTLSEIEIQVNTTTAASTLVVAIYAQDEDTHLPSTMLGYVTLDTATATGTVGQTSFSGGTPSLVQGTQYWIAQARGTAAYATVKGVAEEDRHGLGLATYPLSLNTQITNVGNWATGVPVDGIGALNQYVSGGSINVVLKF